MAPSETATYAVFHVGERLVGATISEVAEVCAVPDLSQLLVSAPGLLGTIQLRGRMIPLYDLERLCGAHSTDAEPKLAVIIQNEDRLIGLRMDRMEGFLSPDAASIQPVAGMEASGTSYSSSCFVHGDKFVSIIDTPALFSGSRLPTAIRERSDHSAHTSSEKRPHLKCTLGRAQIAIDASVIQNTVPRRAVDHGALSVGSCLGSITHNGRRIPVMDTGALLGIGDAKAQDTPEIVLLKLDDDRRIGLAVDSIDSMQAINLSRLASTPETLGDLRQVLSRVKLDQDPKQVFILDTDALHRLDVISNFAEFCDREDSSEPETVHSDDRDAISYSQERYLVFTAGRRMAAPAAQIRRIIRMPDTIVPLDHRFQPVMGVFSVDGISASVVNLSRVSGGGSPSMPPSHALLVPYEGRLFAFAVEEINGLATSVWLAGGETNNGRTEPRVVHLSGEEKPVLPLLDLRALSEDVERRTRSGSAPEPATAPADAADVAPVDGHPAIDAEPEEAQLAAEPNVDAGGGREPAETEASPKKTEEDSNTPTPEDSHGPTVDDAGPDHPEPGERGGVPDMTSRQAEDASASMIGSTSSGDNSPDMLERDPHMSREDDTVA